MLEALRSEPKAARQFLLLAHLYARTDTASLASLRRALLLPSYTPAQVRRASSSHAQRLAGPGARPPGGPRSTPGARLRGSSDRASSREAAGAGGGVGGRRLLCCSLGAQGTWLSQANQQLCAEVHADSRCPQQVPAWACWRVRVRTCALPCVVGVHADQRRRGHRRHHPGRRHGAQQVSALAHAEMLVGRAAGCASRRSSASAPVPCLARGARVRAARQGRDSGDWRWNA